MGIVLFNRTPIFLLARNAFYRGNVGFVGAFMLVSAFLGYLDGRSEHEILLDLLMGLFLGFMAVRAYGTESKMYKLYGERPITRCKKILLCDPTSLSEKEAEIHRQYNEVEHKVSALVGNVALFIIILNIIYSIATHV